MIKILFVCHGRGLAEQAEPLLAGKSRQIEAAVVSLTTVLLLLPVVKLSMIFCPFFRGSHRYGLLNPPRRDRSFADKKYIMEGWESLK